MSADHGGKTFAVKTGIRKGRAFPHGKEGVGVNGVFLAEPISNIIGGLACFVTMWITVYKKL